MDRWRFFTLVDRLIRDAPASLQYRTRNRTTNNNARPPRRGGHDFETYARVRRENRSFVYYANVRDGQIRIVSVRRVRPERK